MATPTGTKSRKSDRWATLRVPDTHRIKLLKLAQQRRWTIKVAAEEAINALEREFAGAARPAEQQVA
jgi:hypothetical protein